MLQVVIVGDSDFGKTTFLGLLYATQVSSGSDETDNFRFHTSPESLEAIGLVFQQLMSGSFPDPVTKQGINEISFQVGSRRTGPGILRFLRRRAWGPSASSTLHFTVPRSQVEEISRRLMGSSVVDKTLNTIYESDVVAILVDSTMLAKKGERPDPSPLSRYDSGVESLLTMIQRLGEPRGRRRLHPIFVFTKFDRVRPEVLRASNVAAAPPQVGETRPRETYAECLLDHNLPRTLARVKAREGGGLKFARPAYFFSWMSTEEATPGSPERIRLRRGEGAGWELDYSSHEYLAFMRYLGDIATGSEE